jgi:hypothetical protein
LRLGILHFYGQSRLFGGADAPFDLVERLLDLTPRPRQACQSTPSPGLKEDGPGHLGQLVGMPQAPLGLVQHVPLEIDVAEANERVLDREGVPVVAGSDHAPEEDRCLQQLSLCHEDATGVGHLHQRHRGSIRDTHRHADRGIRSLGIRHVAAIRVSQPQDHVGQGAVDWPIIRQQVERLSSQLKRPAGIWDRQVTKCVHHLDKSETWPVAGDRPGLLRDSERRQGPGEVARAHERPCQPERKPWAPLQDFGRKPFYPGAQEVHLIAFEKLCPHPLQQPGRAVPIPTRRGVANGLLHESVLLQPCGGAVVKQVVLLLGDDLCQAIAEDVGEEVVVAKPIADTIQRDEEKVVPLAPAKHLAAVVTPDDGAAELSVEPIEGRGAQQEILNVSRLALQGLFPQIVGAWS